MASKYAGIVQDELRDLRGNAMQGATVIVRNVGTTTPAQVYNNPVLIASAAGGDSLINDASTGLPAASGLLQPGVDANGNYTFYADADVSYDLRVVWQGNTFDYRVRPKVVDEAYTSTADLTAALSGTYAQPGVDSTQRLMRKLHSEVADATLMVIADSTSDHLTEWVGLLATALAADWPRWTVLHKLAADGSSAYGAPTTIQTGTGPRTLTILNCSIAGFHPLHFQGTRAAWAIFPFDPDLVMISLGHNESAGATEATWHSRYVSLTESITERLTSDVIVVAQNPSTANGDQALRAEVYRQIAIARGFGFIDVHQAFVDTGNVAALLTDTIHPNASGSALWRDTVKPAFVYQARDAPRAQPPSPLLEAGEQLLVNGDFVTLPDKAQPILTPGAWWADAPTTIEKDLVNYESQRGWAVKLTSASAAQARFGQNLDVKRVRGRWVTVAYRIYIPAGQAQTVGWVYIGDNLTSTSIPGSYSKGTYQWIIASALISAAATSANTYIQVDGANLAGATVTIDRVVMTYGKYPRASSDTADRATITALALKRDNFSGAGSPEGVVSAVAGAIYSRTDLGIRTNEMKYPVSDTSAATTGWVANGGTLTAPTGYLRNTLSVTSGTRNIQTPNAATQPASPSVQYTFSAQARSDALLGLKMLAQFYTAAGAATGSLGVGAPVITNASTFVDVPGLTMTAPADAAFVIVRVSYDSGTNTVGQFIDARHFLMEQAPTAGSYFDGSTVATGITYAWTGATNASSSTAVSSLPGAYVKTGSSTVASTTGWKGLPQATGRAVPAAATDPATTQALVNSLRSLLVDTGIAT